MQLAKKLVLSAKKSGADAVKFQTFKVEKFILSKNKKRFEKLKKFQLTYNEFRILLFW
jgi:sialic acid synthase SpsE